MKICKRCNEEKVFEDFPKHKGFRDGRNSICKECHCKREKEYYQNNKDHKRDVRRQTRKEKIDWYQSIKKDLKCKRCDEDRWYILDFHHDNPNEKEGTISKMIETSSKERILGEIEKCTVLCRNCHGELHYLERMNNGKVDRGEQSHTLLKCINGESRYVGPNPTLSTKV